MTKLTYNIEGMTCDHCVLHVTQALESVAGVKSAKVSLKKKQAEVRADETVNVENLESAVAAAGYKLVP
ncbi:MAG: cation transporter [Streptococcaceae bacterium]|jgi:copper chaperone CopZ|nr:cation transporter [Streptococcaceae bacterium]